jgi:hypothetical protein
MLRDSFPERPLYFTSSGYASTIGLRPYVAEQGLATKLFPTEVLASPRFTVLQGFGAVDVPRSVALWDSVYVAPRSLIARGIWVDRASSDIALRYVITGAVLADVERSKGDTAEAGRIMGKTTELAHAAGLEEVLGLAKPRSEP